MTVSTEEWATWYVSKWPRKAAEFVARHVDATDAFNRDRAAALQAELPAQGRCKMCGRPLSDPLSVERGVGKDCFEKRAAS